MKASRSASAVSTLDPFRPYSVRIHSIRQESPGIATYEMGFDDKDTARCYQFRPGQFNMLHLPGIGEAAISISSDPGQPERLLHTIRAVGNVTQALTRKQTGDQVLLRGPFGSTWPDEQLEGCDVLIAAGGLGLPPLRPLIYEIVRQRDRYGRVTLLYGARRPVDLLFTGEYANWRQAGIDVEVTVDIGDANWSGSIGVVPALFERVEVDAPRTRLLTCGPEVMMRFVIFEAINCGISPQCVYLSLERNMNCAVGFCGHCQLGPTFVCKDGPVYVYERMEPFLHVENF